MKNVLVVDEQQYILFLRDTYEGKASDKRIADEAQDQLPPGSVLMQDMGFQGFEMRDVHIVQPKKKPRGGTLTVEEKAENCRIASIRVRIEHVIGSVKKYRIVHDVIRTRADIWWDKVMETCCGLHNFQIRYKNERNRSNKP